MYYISEKEVEQNFDMKTAISAMKDAFYEYFLGNAGADPRNRTISSSAILNTMPAFINKYKISGLKIYITTKEKTNFVVLIFDNSSGDLIAMIEAKKLGQIRTGAVTALATSLLRPKADVFTLIESGFQAETQLDGILEIYHPSDIRVFSKDSKHAESFASSMSKKFGVDIKPIRDLKKATLSSDIITCITTAKSPILYQEYMPAEYHLNLAGANNLSSREVDERVLKSSEIVVAEQIDQALKESLEIVDFIKTGGKVIDFKDVVGNPEAYSRVKKSVFKSMGIGLEDIVSGYYILKKMGAV
jgi:alanine dehydrogenase